MTKHKHHPHEPASDAEHQQAENASTAEPTPAGVAQPQAAENPLAKLQAELAAAKDRELRCHAELDNFRKRATREREDLARYSNMGLLRDLLPVLDNVERAIQAADKNADAAALLDGFKMVDQQMRDVLNRHNCKPIEALHMPFDPNVHHAVMQQPSDEYPANTVLMVTQNGYQLHDRVVRPSQVIVSIAK